MFIEVFLKYESYRDMSTLKHIADFGKFQDE